MSTTEPRAWSASLAAESTAPPPPIARRLWPRTVAIALAALLLAALPLAAGDYVLSALLVPFLVLGLAGVGQNLITGYAGQLSVGSAAFMSVGAFSTYNALVRVPGMPLLGSFLIGGLVAALVGLVFGLPSLRIKGFYLVVSTLAAQFFVEWLFTNTSWFTNHNASGVITAPPLVVLGMHFDTPGGHYVLALGVVVLVTLLTRNVVRGRVGRSWMAVRDIETAAAVVGIPTRRAKLSAFALSSFVCGIAGALWAFAYLGTVEPHGFDLDRSFQILFIAILGGLGSVEGPFLGAGFVVLFPVALDLLASRVFAAQVDPGLLQNLEKIVFGSLVIVFLIKQPAGLARLLSVATTRLRSRLLS